MSISQPNGEEKNYGVAVGRIQSDVMHILATLVDMKQGQMREYEKLDIRMTKVEKFMWKITGLVTVVPFVFTAVLWFMERTSG